MGRKDEQDALFEQYAAKFYHVYQFADDIVHLEIIADQSHFDQTLPANLPSPSSSSLTIQPGNLIVTNLIRYPPLIRYNSRDYASFLYSADGTRVANRNLFYFIGRNNTRSVPIGDDWLSFADVQQHVLAPYGLQDELAQVDLSYSQVQFVRAELRVYKEEVEERVRNEMMLRWQTLLAKVVGGRGFEAVITLTHDHSLFIRSRNQKLLKFVDRR